MVYDVADPRHRTYTTWNPSRRDSDNDDLPYLPRIRSLARDAYRNQPIIFSGVQTKLNKVIGSGLKLQSTPNAEILEKTPDELAKWASRFESYFGLWADSVDCDFERTKTFAEIQRVAYLSYLVNGDIVFMLPHVDRGNINSVTIKLIEADQLCNPHFAPDTQKTAGGITVSENGEPLVYHFSATHPGARIPPAKWIDVAAYSKNGKKNVYILSRKNRPNQRRGVSSLVSVLEKLKVLDEYTNSELEAAVVSSLFTIFVEKEGEALDAEDGDLKLKPGMMIELNPGEKISSVNPLRPNPNYEPFTTAILKQIGAALQVPYEILLKHFSSSYSASRGAILEMWDMVKTERLWFQKHFNDIIKEAVLEELVLLGKIEAEGFLDDPLKKEAWLKCTWNGPAQGQLNAVQETRAAVMRIENGLSTREEETASMTGGDFTSNVNRAKRENELMLNSGLKEKKQ